MPKFIVRRTIDQFKHIEADSPEQAQHLALEDDTNWEWSDETYETELDTEATEKAS